MLLPRWTSMTTSEATGITSRGLLPLASTVSASVLSVLMMLFGLGGGFDLLHNVLHFASGAIIIAFLLKIRTHLSTYLLGFGLFYFVIGGVGTAHHQTIDATFLNTPFHPGHIYIGLTFITAGIFFRLTHRT
jgi:hypothetical protein